MDEPTPEDYRRFARIYRDLVEELVRQGVEEYTARFEARCVAYAMVFEDDTERSPWQD